MDECDNPVDVVSIGKFGEVAESPSSVQDNRQPLATQNVLVNKEPSTRSTEFNDNESQLERDTPKSAQDPSSAVAEDAAIDAEVEAVIMV